MTLTLDPHLEGEMFGSILVIQQSEDGEHWIVLCECNESFEAREGDLTAGLVTSCGCEDSRKRGASWPNSPTTQLSSKWKAYALCGQFPGDTFYPPQGGRAAVAQAKKICLQCDVRVECLEWALDIGDLHGVWGALTGEERKALLRQRQARPIAVGHCGGCGSSEHEFIDCDAQADAVVA